MKSVIAAALWMALTLHPAARAGEAGDAVFAERGPWSLDQGELHWSLQVAGPSAEGFVPIADGEVTLTQAIDPSDQQPILQVVQQTEAGSRTIGPFPISGGDPVLIFFLEQTARDMARLTGGSPFYIRNRIKDAVFRGGQITRDQDRAVARFQPFADDPNAGRMMGFQTLTLSFTFDDPKAPIREFEARTEGATPGYLNRMVLQ